jgi:acyl-CoA synthetase (AMP-forming)/AMP-acid ligase II
MSASPEQVERLVALTGSRYVTGWGMTENSGAFLTATSFIDHGRADASSVMSSAGRPVMETIVRVVDAENLCLESGAVGELVVSSPSLMSGYFKKEEESTNVFDGTWYRTGDMGYLDPDGFVHIVDRRTDLIVSGGMNIYPRELEQVIESMPEVAKCVVVGVAHPQWGRTPVAIVSRTPEGVLTQSDVVDRVRESLASYKKPTAVLFREKIPENLSGKVARAELSDWAAAQLRDNASDA